MRPSKGNAGGKGPAAFDFLGFTLDWEQLPARLRTQQYLDIDPDLVVAGYANPKLEAVLESGVAVGAFRVDALAHARVAETAMNEWALYRDVFRTSRAANDPALSEEERLHRFGPYSDGSGLASLYSGQYLEESSFLRLRSLAVTARLPGRLLGVRLPAGELTLAGRDLWTWTDFGGPDPEVQKLAPPHPRVWTSALTVRF